MTKAATIGFDLSAGSPSVRPIPSRINVPADRKLTGDGGSTTIDIMDDQPFRFDHDMPNRFVRVEFKGFWTHETIEAFRRKAAEVMRAAIEDGATPGQSRILLIGSDFPVQDKDLTAKMGELMPMYSMLARRFAVVVSGSALQRMQLRRLLVPDTSKLFLDEAEARAWLLEA